MMFSRRPSKPQPATLEEYDSDANCVKPGTRVTARSDASSNTKPTDRRVRDGASDSGYSSHTAASNPSAAPLQSSSVAAVSAPPPPPTSTSASTVRPKPRPIVHTQSESRTRPPPARSHSRNPSVPRTTSAPCAIPDCTNPDCASSRNSERRYTIPQKDYQQQPNPKPAAYTQPQPPQPSPTYPTARPRPASTSQATRPVSWAGDANYPYSAYPPPITHGPPPSPSAYVNLYRQQYSNYPPPVQPIATCNPPPQPFFQPSPTSPDYSTRPQSINFSARQPPINNPYPLASSTMITQPQTVPLTRTTSLSARRPDPFSTPSMPGAFPIESAFYESDSDYYDDEHDDRERALTRRHNRDSKMMPPPRRPSIKTVRTTPAAMTAHELQTSQRRSVRLDDNFDFNATSDGYVESDGTLRPVADRRYSSANSSRSRRPSISTTASSARTKATTVSSGSGPGHIIIEGPDGRRRAYPSREQYDDLMRRVRQQQQQKQDDAEAYQNAVRGAAPVELTAENIRQSQQRRTSVNGSRLSGHSRKSSKSQSKSEGIQIVSGETVLHVVGDARIEMRAADERGPAQVIIDRGGARESNYYPQSSKSSGSRVGRSRGGSEKGSRELPIREQKERGN